MHDCYKLFDIPFVTNSQREIMEEIIELSKLPMASSVLFANAHVVVEAESRAEFKSILNQATLVIPDGVPLTWLLHSKGHKEAERYSGPDLMNDIFSSSAGGRHFFLGSTDENLKLIKRKFKGNGVGFFSPPFRADGFTDEELTQHLKLVNDSRADYIWVGLGAPKQEKYAVEMARRASRGVWLAVGAAFDFYAGVKPRAPEYLQRFGLEWAFRMATEPKRLSRRYLKSNPRFIRLALKELLS